MQTVIPEYRRIQHEGIPHYGQHALVTALACDSNLLSIEKIYEFLRTMANDIGMVCFGPPIVARFGSGIETGISGVQLIETSSITIHTNDTHRDMYLDVFSCKSFEEKTIESVLDDFFSPSSVTIKVIYRK